MISLVRASSRHRILASASIAAAILAACAISAFASSPLKITNCFNAASRPKQLTLTCADANTLVKSLAWSSFGGPSALARGTFVVNTCEPNCADGKYVSYPVKLQATGARACKHDVRVYAKLTLQFPGRAPGRDVPRTWKLGCPI
jgi:hypothetical protein